MEDFINFRHMIAQRILVITIIAIAITGIVGIPLGDPRFLGQALGLEFSFIVLAVLSFKKYRYAYIANFVISVFVIIGNTVSPKHLEIMSTMHPLYNGIVLLIGGYILQGFLLVSNAVSYNQQRKLLVDRKSRID